MQVVVTDRRYPDVEDPFGDIAREAGADIEYATFESETDVREGCRDADVVLTSKAPMTQAVLAEMEHVRGIIRMGTGYDTIDLKAATEFGVPVSNVPGRYCADDLATHAIGLTIAAAHEMVVSDRDVRTAQGFGERRDINPIYGGTFGIVGLGHIGRATIPKARGLDMDVLAVDPYVPDDLIEGLGVEPVSFEALLERADCVSIHAPLTAETYHLFSTAEFERMNEWAVLVNTARGPIVDEAALVAALDDGELWAAGLDVFETEPPDDTPALASDRIVCTPHHGAKCDRSREAGCEIVRAELERYLAGDRPRNVVNPGALAYSDGLLNPERHRWE